MANVTIKQIATAIRSTLEEADGIKRAEEQHQLSEGIPDIPLMQVYWAGFNKSPNSETDRISFGDDSNQPVRITEHRFFVDILAATRKHIGEDYAAIAETADAVDTVLEAENAPPYFGLAGIKAFDYEVEPLNWENTDPIAVGERFIITIVLF